MASSPIDLIDKNSPLVLGWLYYSHGRQHLHIAVLVGRCSTSLGLVHIMRILVINRSFGEFASYGDYIDHTDHRVAYVTIASHLGQIPRNRAAVEVVDRLATEQEVIAAARQCAVDVGGFDRVVTTTETDQLTVARLREVFRCAGPSVDAVTSFRDKLRMKTIVRDARLATPRFAAVSTIEDVTRFQDSVGVRLVAKPRFGVASAGVRVLKSSADASKELGDLELSDYQVEEFVDGPIWHVDGIRSRGLTTRSFAWQYIGTCLRFAQGQPLGSVSRNDSTAREATRFATQVVSSLGMNDGVFHLETIESRRGFVFMEVAARAGGSYIPYLLRDVYGVDFVEHSVRLQAGLAPRHETKTLDGPSCAGGLVFPEVVGARVLRVHDMDNEFPELYRKTVAPIGHVFAGHGEYEDVLGTFLFRGRDTRETESAIRSAMQRFGSGVRLEHSRADVTQGAQNVASILA